MTEGKIRSSGFWIIGSKHQKSIVVLHVAGYEDYSAIKTIANLSEDCLTPGPPFTFVGVEMFEPWN
jgi:hypothetical protein